MMVLVMTFMAVVANVVVVIGITRRTRVMVVVVRLTRRMGSVMVSMVTVVGFMLVGAKEISVEFVAVKSDQVKTHRLFNFWLEIEAKRVFEVV